jgi:hypothetical protein
MNVISNATSNGFTIEYIIPFHVWAIPAAAVIVSLGVIVGIAREIARRKRKKQNSSN